MFIIFDGAGKNEKPGRALSGPRHARHSLHTSKRCLKAEAWTAATSRNDTLKNHGQKFTLRLLQALGPLGQGSTITLMCHCAEGEPHCHRHILQKVLSGNI